MVFNSDSGSEGSTTISKAMGNLFHYERSYLNFFISKVEDFNLNRLLDPFSENFIELEDPTILGGWLHSVGGKDGKEDPGIQLQMIKDFKHLHEFVLGRMKRLECGNSTEAYLRRDKIVDNVKNIDEVITKKKLISKLKRLDNQQRVEKLKARRTLNPDDDFNVQVAVQTWFNSPESRDLEKECDRYYQNVKDGIRIGARSFTKYANFCRFYVLLHDRNRQGVYSFTNRDFSERKPKFLPTESFYPEDGFKSLPSDWNPDVGVDPDAEPSCWVLELSGDNRGLKGGKSVKVILSRPVMELCLRYREMKDFYLGERPLDAPFFESAEKKALSGLRLTPGSLLDKFAKACNISGASVNTFRKSFENIVLESPVLKNDVEELQSHSKRVGVTHYYTRGANVRSNCIVQLNKKEGAVIEDEKDENILRKRKRMDDLEKIAAIERAKKVLFDDKTRKSMGKGKVKQQERSLIQKIFKNIVKDKFPGIIIITQL